MSGVIWPLEDRSVFLALLLRRLYSPVVALKSLFHHLQNSHCKYCLPYKARGRVKCVNTTYKAL